LSIDHAREGNRIGIDRAGNPVVRYRYSEEAVAGLVRVAEAVLPDFAGLAA